MAFSRFALASFLLSIAKADILPSSSHVVSSQAVAQPSVHCHTVLGTVSVSSVPTTTKTHYIHERTPVVVLTTVQDTVTSTPLASTILETDYATTTVTTTETPVTDVFSTTSTDYEYTTSWVTPNDVTLTAWSTDSITQTSTSTIPTSGIFTPVLDTIATPTAYKKRSLVEDEGQCVPWTDDFKYPQEVVCDVKHIIKTTTVSTVTEAPTTATAVAPSTTVTLTSTITSSTVLIPSDVSTTLSLSTTSYVTIVSDVPAVTSTVTSTTSQVVAITTTTAYAACASNNIASSPLSSDYGSYANEYIYQILFNNVPGMTLSVGDSTSAESCCASCQESSTCAMSYYRDYGTSKWCYLVLTISCSFSDDYSTAYMEAGSSTGGFMVSNGMCGHYKA